MATRIESDCCGSLKCSLIKLYLNGVLKMKSTKLAFSLSVVAAAALFATGAGATGTVSPTAAGVGAVTYAMEGINASPLTLPNIVYTINVGRATGQDITVIYTLPVGVTFNATPAIPVGGVGFGTAVLKRGGVGTNEVVYSIPVTAAVAAGTLITLTAPVITSGAHGMTASNLSLPLTIKILDQVETACVDNNGTPATCFVTSQAAKMAPAVDFFNTTAAAVGVASDALTVTDVNRPVPLAGFVAANGDTATEADATVMIKTTTLGIAKSDNSGDFTSVAGDTITMTVTDATGFLGLAPGGFYYDLNNDGLLTAGEAFTITGNVATKLFTGTTVGLNADRQVAFISNAVTPLGTSRAFTIAGSITPAAGIAHAFTVPATWWTWGSNGTILETSMFSSTAGYNNRFVLMNYGTNAVTYSAQCLVEAGKTAVAGSAATGTLAAGTQTVVLAANVCTITGAATATGNTAARGGVRFTINAPSSVVKGVYNSVNSATGAIDSIEMVRPTTNAQQF